MTLKIHKPKVYDHTDGDLVIINKSVLAHDFELVQSCAHSSTGWVSFIGFSITFFLTAFVSENFKNFGPVTGDNIRSVVILLGVITLVLALYLFCVWFRLRKKYAPDQFAKDLVTVDPQDIEMVFKKYTKSTTRKSRSNK